MDDQLAQLLNTAADEARETAENHGFETSWENFPTKIALIHSEVSEAFEAYRDDDLDHVPDELADIIIRTIELAAGLDIDIGEAVVEKMAANRERPEHHGGKKF